MILVSASDVQILMLSRGAAIKTLDLDAEGGQVPQPTCFQKQPDYAWGAAEKGEFLCQDMH